MEDDRIYSGIEALKYIYKKSYDDRKNICDVLTSLDSTDINLLLCDSDIRYDAYHQYAPTLYKKFHCTVFRGQCNSDWGLIPTCMRSKMGTDVLSKTIMKTHAKTFQRIITSSYLYHEFNTVKIQSYSGELSDTIYDDPWILAQHYGLPTPMIDYTSDPYVAMFFACTKSSEDGWEPLTSKDIKDNKYGRIFMEEYCMYPLSKSSSSVISPTLFSRPISQKGYLMHYSKCDATNYITFKHDPELSQRLLDKFNDGKLLFSDKEMNVNRVASRIRNSKILPKDIFCESISSVDCSDDVIKMALSRGFSFSDDIPNEITRDFDLKKDDIYHIDDPQTIIDQCMINEELSINDMYELFSGLKMNRIWTRKTFDLIRES